MNHRPVATITFILISVAVTLMAPIFDYSVYGVNGHPTEWLSFLPSEPFRHMGLSLVVSPFLHINFQHLITNMIFFAPVAMMMERKKSGFFLTLHFSLIHTQVLLLLVMVNYFVPLDGKAFLGSSHVVIGLYTYWSLANKKYGMLFFALLMLSVGLWQSQSPLTLLAHALGFMVGVEILLLGRLRDKLRTKSSY
jgi:membrane associated rhomboid family serine protease